MEDWLDWSAKQGRILTGGGVAESVFSAANNFAFDASELPHHHLAAGSTHDAFAQWRRDAETAAADARAPAWLTGAWGRAVFIGGWEHSNDDSETCYNLQTPSVFIDIRIPHRRGLVSDAASAAELSDAELRLLARQHAFGGYTRCNVGKGITAGWVNEGAMICTRHHAIDWNFLGTPRPRPNKWLAEPRLGVDRVDDWKEWSYARGASGQSYYMEQWYRLAQGDAGDGVVAALRATSASAAAAGDAMVIVCGDHFNYLRARPAEATAGLAAYGAAPFAAVDAALADGRHDIAEGALALEAGHGRVSEGWRVDASLQPWREGGTLSDVFGGPPRGSSPSGAFLPALHGGGVVRWGELEFEILENSCESAAALVRALGGR